MKHVIEMIQNARRLAGPDHPEFLAELDAALHRLNTYDEIESDRMNNLASSERFRRRSNQLAEEIHRMKTAMDVLGLFLHARGVEPGELAAHTIALIKTLSSEKQASEERVRALQDALHHSRSSSEGLLEENAILKAENEKLARMVDQRGDAEAASIRPMPVGAAAEKTPDDTIEIIRDALRQGGVCKIRKYIGQEWCQTDSKCDGCAVVAFPFRDAPSIVLCNVHRCVETGELTRTPVPITELPRV